MARPARTDDDSSVAGDIFGVVTDRQSYKNLCYLVLAAPLGMAYYTFVTMGLVLGALLSPIGIGLVVLFVTLLTVRLFAGFERRLANALLGLELQAENGPEVASARGVRARITSYLEAPSTWRGLGFLMVKFPLGVVAVVLLIPLFTALSLVTAPLRYPYAPELVTVNDEPITWSIETLPEAVLAVMVAAVIGVLVLHLSNGFAYVARQMATALLDEGVSEPRGGDGKPAASRSTP
ncbi:sensor domain-containing protein [Halopiger xanaduensis]|uniref:Two-component system sensor kinase n=1 Tax=Halopiger xanaduensis (strain DSM 18323 / JCM 14033 / SH-6) TaxID=797210 RepID=F8D5H8_HALXS|nr:sensor domain-containing protein [Halopiger xanaduensis]AEH38814.1 two-component system sensor kinase [Halopiger xanaduensis SH-6]